MKKFVFLDLDGTLLGHDGQVPESSKKAIQTARSNGHEVFVCTGRAIAEIWDEILAIGFDGLISSNGSYIEHDDKTIFHEQYEQAEVKTLLDFFDAHNAVYTLETNAGIFTNEKYMTVLKNHMNAKLETITDEAEKAERIKSNEQWYSIFTVTDDLYRTDVNNITYIVPTEEVSEKLLRQYSDLYEIYKEVVPTFGPLSGDICRFGVSKGSGIQRLIKHLGADMSQTIGIGDGSNDIPMLELCEIGVAMGNASDIVKASANQITGHVDEDGVYEAFLSLGLI